MMESTSTQQRQTPKKSSGGVLRSIMTTRDRDHRRAKSQNTSNVNPSTGVYHGTQTVPLLPPDHPHSKQAVQAEDNVDQGRQGRQARKEDDAPPQKRSKSTVSLRSLRGFRDKDKDDEKETKREKKSRKDRDREGRREKSRVRDREKHSEHDDEHPLMRLQSSKSTTSLKNLLTLNRSSKDLNARTTEPRDKENVTPPQSAVLAQPPIYAQEMTIPLKPSQTRESVDSDRPRSRKEMLDEIDLYTPKDYSPSKQRNFAANAPPTLNRPRSSGRPKSWALPGASALLGEGLNSRDEARNDGIRPRSSRIVNAKTTAEELRGERNASSSSSEQPLPKAGLNVGKRGSRVMAAVAAFNGKCKSPFSTVEESSLDAKAIDAAFESVLDSRNVPENMREKMRSLTLRVKADFVKQDQGTAAPTTPGNTATTPFWGHDDTTIDQAAQTSLDEHMDNDAATKRTRALSTKVISKGETSSPKKQRPGSRPTSVHVSQPSSPVKGMPSPRASSGNRGPQAAIPEDFVQYLRQNSNPTEMEVGRLHKLRLLLRNETVAWVDSFISLGGMVEVVELLHRIMAIEWREEHEDQLLHEALRCLKGLCTTGIALKRLEDVADTLFPSLLGMIFDEEKKGPSEFNTRGIIINVLFAYLSAAVNDGEEALSKRARTVLGYLTDPKKPEESQLIPFVLEMRQPRPYRVWCNEVSNVSREVFWIFLHQHNVVPLPTADDDTTPATNSAVNTTSLGTTRPSSRDPSNTTPPPKSYSKRHFPGDRPPVPAAPYIGGVEWDATTYMTSHLDLLNGLIASLPSTPERNHLRAELNASGWEKLMGATLRTCKEKFYSGVHSGLQSWVGAAVEDAWDTEFVRCGPSQEEMARAARAASPRKAGSPKKEQAPPQIEGDVLGGIPKLDLGIGAGEGNGFDDGGDDGWLL